MPFDRPTITTIVERIERGIEARLFSGLALLRNAVLRILARVFAGAIHGLYGYLEWISTQLFVTTSETFWLNQHGKMWGVERRPGSFATGTVIFTGTNGTNIPIDTRVQSEEGVEYLTTAAGNISGGSVTLAVQAVEAGDDGNFDSTVTPTPVFQLITPITGVDDEVGLDSSMTGGEDEETDDAYRDRILERIQQTPAGGSASDYVRWAKEVTGVEDAWCYPLDNGPGTVVTVITATGSDPTPSGALLTEVENYIEARRPVTAQQSVESIKNLFGLDGAAEVDLGIKIEPNEVSYQQKIEENLQLLFKPHRPGTDIPIANIQTAIGNSGVTNFEIVEIYVDGDVRAVDSDIVLSGYEYPKQNDNFYYSF